jgi:hypothetical protein
MTRDELKERIEDAIDAARDYGGYIDSDQAVENLMNIAVGERIGKAGGTDPVTLAEKVCDE